MTICPRSLSSNRTLQPPSLTFSSLLLHYSFKMFFNKAIILSAIAALAIAAPANERGTYPAAPSLPLHFTMRHDPEGGPCRTVIVSAIMCALIAGTDHRLFNGIVFENMCTLAFLFLTGARCVLLDLVWSAIIATVTAFIYPINFIALLIGIDWVIPGRPISFLLEHGQQAVSILFYVIALLGLGWMPPLLPVRWAIDWVLGYYPRLERRR